ncbi:hypothetical protein ACQ9LF_10255 [Anaerohalosphaeraceae bacterium U12dextr]
MAESNSALSAESSGRMLTPYYHLVPKDFAANLRFRREMIRMGASDVKAAQELWIMCKRDPLFYVNTFVFTYDPRKVPSALPFITYDYQDDAILQINQAIGNYDLFIEKSRDMGASWLCLLVPQYRFQFFDLQSFLMVSRVENLVDKTEDPDSLFWKIDFIHKNQPAWLRPSINRNKLHIYNQDNGSTIDGASTTGDVGRGGRRTAVLLDEFASVDDGHAVLAATRDTTPCRLFNSTPKGVGNAFYDMRMTDIRKLRMHWSQHPIKSKGLYTTENGAIVVLDDRHKTIPGGYEFIADGKLRSPWYDQQCKRAAHPMEIAQELDIDYLGSNYQFFDPAILTKLQADDVRPAYKVGDLDYDLQTAQPLEFLAADKGKLHLWVNLDMHGKIPDTMQCVMGIDIAAGTGASNSCISIANQQTREKIAELSSSGIAPHTLAKYAVALARWCNGAYMIWEANGPGAIFGPCVLELGYRNIYYRRNDKALGARISDTPGWYSTKESKLVLLGEYRKALAAGHFVNRSYHALRECREYVFQSNGSVEHSRSINTVDPTGARDNHGDRVIADALCWKGMKDYKPIVSQTADIPRNCLWARRQQANERKQAKVYW